jgi:hypothetical protein
MNSVRQLEGVELYRCLQHKLGEQLRAMYANETYPRPPARLLDPLRDPARLLDPLRDIELRSEESFASGIESK